MNEEFQHQAVLTLADFADHWSRAPMLQEPAIRAALDQFMAGTAESMNELAELTEGERITLAFGYMLCSQWLHEQLEHLGMHDDQDDIANVCEACGLFAGHFAASALAP